MGRKAQQKSPGNATVQTSRGLEKWKKGRPFVKPIASGAFVFAKTPYTCKPAKCHNVTQTGSPAPLFPPLPLVFRRLPRRLAPGGQKPPFVWRKVVEDRRVTCLPETHFLMKHCEPGTHFLMKCGERLHDKQKVACARRVTCPFSMARSPSWPGQLFSIQKLISACPAWSTRSRRFNPCLVSSVGRAPVC